MDSRPQLEGRALLRRLLSHGIACTYVLLNAASYIMSEVTKVLRLHCYAVAQPVIQYTACLPSKFRLQASLECYFATCWMLAAINARCSGESVYITSKGCLLCLMMNLHLHSISVTLELLQYFSFTYVIMLSIY